MTCEFAGRCGGRLEVRCLCECDHCEEDLDHFAECLGCEDCDIEEASPKTILDPLGAADEALAHRLVYVANFFPDERWMRCYDDGCTYERRATNWEQCENSQRGHTYQPSLRSGIVVCSHCTQTKVRLVA